MLSAVVKKEQVRKAINLLRTKLTPELVASEEIEAEINQRGSGFYGVLGSGRTAVEINVPPFKKNPHGLIAQEKNRFFLCHNGQLNPRLQISRSSVLEAMRKAVRDVKLGSGAVKPYVVVADLGDRSNILAQNLAKFIYVCQRLAETGLQNLTDEKLKELAQSTGKKRPKKRIANAVQYERSPYVVAWVKRMAKGLCDLCRKPAPFKTGETPYLECHHIIHLSAGGPDIRQNTVALCPNCHRRMHIVNVSEDRNKLTRRAQAREQ